MARQNLGEIRITTIAIIICLLDPDIHVLCTYILSKSMYLSYRINIANYMS